MCPQNMFSLVLISVSLLVCLWRVSLLVCLCLCVPTYPLCPPVSHNACPSRWIDCPPPSAPLRVHLTPLPCPPAPSGALCIMLHFHISYHFLENKFSPISPLRKKSYIPCNSWLCSFYFSLTCQREKSTILSVIDVLSICYSCYILLQADDVNHIHLLIIFTIIKCIVPYPWHNMNRIIIKWTFWDFSSFVYYT